MTGTGLSFISRRYWRAHPARLSACIAGIAFGVALMLAVALIDDALKSSYRSYLRQTLGATDLVLLSHSEEGMSEELLGVLPDFEGIAAAAPVLNRQSLIMNGEASLSLRLRGIDPAKDAELRPLELYAGRALEPSDERAVLLSRPLAEMLGLTVGARVELVTPEGFRGYQLVGIFETNETRGLLSQLALMPLREAQRAFAGGERLVSQVDLRLESGVAPEALRPALAARVAALATVLEPEGYAMSVLKVVRSVRFMFGLAEVLALLAAMYLIASNVALMLVERQEELRLLRILGARGRLLGRYLLAETLTLGAAGSVLGLPLGFALAWLLAATVQGNMLVGVTLEPHDLRFPPLLLPLAFGVGVLTSFLSSLPALYRLSRHSLSDAAQPSVRPPYRLLLLLIFLLPAVLLPVPEAYRGLQALLFFGLVLVCALLCPLLLAEFGGRLSLWRASPFWLFLAGGSLKRYRNRLGTAAAALMLSLSLLVGVFGTVQSYRASLHRMIDSMFGWDLSVSQKSLGFRVDVPLSDALRWELALIPGVSLVSATSVSFAHQGEANANLYVLDTSAFAREHRFRSVQGVASHAILPRLREERSIVVSATLATLYGLQAGDTLELSTTTGRHPYSIIAIVEDVANADAIFMSRSTYLRDWRNTHVDLFSVTLEETADVRQVADLIHAHLGERYPLEVKTSETRRAEVNSMIRDTFGLSRALVLVIVVMALAGIVNAGLACLWGLQRELATLRALGASMRLIRRALLAEAALSSLLGALFGLGLGTLLSSLLVRSMQGISGIILVWQPPISAYVLLALLSLTGVLIAGLVLARAASRIGVTETLRYSPSL